MEQLRQKMVAWLKNNFENNRVFEDNNLSAQDMVEIIFLMSFPLIHVGSSQQKVEIEFGAGECSHSFMFYLREEAVMSCGQGQRIATGSLLEQKIIFHLHFEELKRMVKNFSEAGFLCVGCREKAIGQKEGV